MADLAAIGAQHEAATARLAYWESQWRASASGSEKEAWYDAIVRDLHDAVAGFAAAVEALEEAQKKAKRLREKLLRPDKRLHQYEADIHQSDCGACDLLAILGESQ